MKKKISRNHLALKKSTIRQLSNVGEVGGGALNTSHPSCGPTCVTCEGATCTFAGCGTH
jgi:hypothetical protein